MKKLSMIALVLGGCISNEQERPLVITGIETGRKGMCRYTYSTASWGGYVLLDKCDKYNIGDTIK